MSTAKSTTITLRINPSVKKALRAAAAREHRSITNMVEVLIRDHCQRNSIEIEGTAPRSESSKREENK